MLGRATVDKDKVAIVVGMPTKHDDDNGPFTGTMWGMLAHALSSAGVQSECWVYAQACHSDKDLTLAVERKCHQDLIKYLKLCGVEYALLVGSKAMNIFADGAPKGGMKKNHGTLIHREGINGVPVYNYQDVFRDRDMQPTFEADVKFFKRLIDDQFTNPYFKHYDVTTPKGKAGLIEHIKRSECTCFDLETEGLNPRKGKVKMLGLAWRDGMGNKDVCSTIIYPNESPFLLYHPSGTGWAWDSIQDLFDHCQRTTAQNGIFDMDWLANRGVRVHLNFDTLGAAYLENNLLPHGLKFMAINELDMPWYADGIDHEKIDRVTMQNMERYCALDCVTTLLIREKKLQEGMKHIAGSYQKPLAKIIMPGIRVLQRVQERGVYVDKIELTKAASTLIIAQDDSKQKLDILASRNDINYDSPTQLRKLLYGKKSEGGFGYKPIFVDKDADPDEDDPTTGKAALKKLARLGSDFAQELLNYRQYSKAVSAFINPWTEMLHETDRLHPRYNITRTATGRLSCEGPNLQQVSRLKLIRNLIRATPGYVFVEADYSQVELRIAAWIGRIISMLDIYRAGGDIHVRTASEIVAMNGDEWAFMSPAEQKDMRQRAKAVNFGFIYGMSSDGFLDYADASYDVVLTKKEAQAYRDVYFSLYPELSDWHERVRKQVKRDGYVKTPTERVRLLPNVNSIDSYLQGKAIRCGINTPVQSFASDLTMLSMIDLEVAFEQFPQEARIVGQCHDAIFFEVREDSLDLILPIIKRVMENPRVYDFGASLDVPLEVEIKYGKCWGDPGAKIF